MRNEKWHRGLGKAVCIDFLHLIRSTKIYGATSISRAMKIFGYILS